MATLYQQSLQDPETFWAREANTLTWFKTWQSVMSGSFAQHDVQWFAGATLNASYNCLDRHLPARAEQIAILWEGDDPRHTQTLTYRELHEQVCRLANVLLQHGVQKGDTVCIYLPMIPEAVIAMLACARIGAIHSVVFAGFSAQALQTRVLDANCRLVITANEGVRGNKIIPLKETVDHALSSCPLVRHVLVVRRTPHPVPWQEGRDVWYHDVMSSPNVECPAVEIGAENPLFILYTSGSTGKPKGIMHATGGYLLYAAVTHRHVFDYRDNDVFWCTADVGWVTGHTYGVYGPLANGATIVLFEGVPHYPTPSRYWELIEKYKVNQFYTAPTALRALRKEGDEWVKNFKMESLRVLGSVGEPINPDVWEWFAAMVGKGRCPVVDTWWQTETGGIMISALPHTKPLKPGSAALPFFGVVPKIVDDEGKELPDNTMGKLVITQPWPGMMLTVYGDRQRFIDSYFKPVPGVYFTGDLAWRDEDGYFWIEGRSDDVLKVSGHRIGTAEVESALITHPAVSEAAVVGIPDDIKGHAIYAFVTLKSRYMASDNVKQEINKSVRDTLGAIAIPKYIQWAEALPKTRSGKIMRRLLRKIANNENHDLGDLSTLADPDVIDALVKEKLK